jgi:hypothetical protein
MRRTHLRPTEARALALATAPFLREKACFAGLHAHA